MNANRASCGIAVMAKASAPGRTKTRLVPPLDYDDAAALNTAFLHDVTDNILLAASRAAPDATIAAYAAYGPPGTEDFFRSRFPGVDLIAAWLPNFGACLLHAIEQMFARGHSAAVVLNADSPTLPTALLNETAALLARPVERRWLLSARAESCTPPPVRGHRLEHRARCRTNARARARNRARAACA